MSFVSFEFLALLAIVVPLYYLAPRRWANLVLLAASYAFYGYWYPPYLALLIGTTYFDFRIARRIEAAASPRHRLRLLVVSLCVNFGILFVFKYYGLVVSLLWTGTQGQWDPTAPGGALGLMLPLGISFYTFQEVSYVIDVYRGEIKAVERFGRLSLFVSFFPQLVAGPIERAGNILPQFATRHALRDENVVAGLQLMLLGFFKKLVIADRVAVYVKAVYADPAGHNPATLMAATLLFGVQIYADFSAYSDIAVGAARLMGFRLMENFRQPYLSTSVTEFWHRWHISLSTWFRDYLYIPLGGSRAGAARRRTNILIVFLVSGLWHGAHVKFVLWGAVHGLAVLVEDVFRRRSARVTARLPARLTRGAAWMATFAFVMAAWVPFRAATLADTMYIWGHLYPWPLNAQVAAPAGGLVAFLWIAAAAALLFGLDVLNSRNAIWPTLARWPRPVRWMSYYGVSVCILWFGVWGQYEFIYFQF